MLGQSFSYVIHTSDGLVKAPQTSVEHLSCVMIIKQKYQTLDGKQDEVSPI